MSENLPMVSDNTPIGLDPKVASQLQTWEEWISYYLQLGEMNNSVSWIKADLLVELEKRFGGGSLEKFSVDVGEPRSTVVNYIRTAKAFPPETRVPHLSFSHHYQASFADSYDENKKEFVTDSRFNIINEAADSNLSTRKLKDKIQQEKNKNLEDVTPPKCEFCKQEDKNVMEFVIYSPGSGFKGERILLHMNCLQTVIKGIRDHT